MYPTEHLASDVDDGTMPESRNHLEQAVIGRRIVAVDESSRVLTLDDGRRVRLVEQSDCCAFTTITSFLLDPALVEHAITGVGTTGEFTTWHLARRIVDGDWATAPQLAFLVHEAMCLSELRRRVTRGRDGGCVRLLDHVALTVPAAERLLEVWDAGA